MRKKKKLQGTLNFWYPNGYFLGMAGLLIIGLISTTLLVLLVFKGGAQLIS